MEKCQVPCVRNTHSKDPRGYSIERTCRRRKTGQCPKISGKKKPSGEGFTKDRWYIMSHDSQDDRKKDKESKCSVEVYSRVTGFFRPTKSWNKGKTAEFGDRKVFKVDKSN